jgi:hypothetical protein
LITNFVIVLRRNNHFMNITLYCYSFTVTLNTYKTTRKQYFRILWSIIVYQKCNFEINNDNRLFIFNLQKILYLKIKCGER